MIDMIDGATTPWVSPSVLQGLAQHRLWLPCFHRQKQAAYASEDKGAWHNVKWLQGATLSRAFSRSLTGMFVQVRCIMVSTQTCKREHIQADKLYRLAWLTLGLQGLT